MHHRRTHINNHLDHQAIWLHQICMVNLLPMNKQSILLQISHIHIHHGKVVSKLMTFFQPRQICKLEMCGNWLEKFAINISLAALLANNLCFRAAWRFCTNESASHDAATNGRRTTASGHCDKHPMGSFANDYYMSSL